MKTEYRKTLQEDVYWRLVDEKQEMLSDAAHSVYRQAQLAAFAANLDPTYSFEPQEYHDAMEKMRHAATEITARDRGLLAKLARAALAAAASMDPDDEDEHLVHGVYVGDLHRYYRMISSMVEPVLLETAAEQEKGTHSH
jgi:hypothetical protein